MVRTLRGGARLTAVLFLFLWQRDAHAQAGPILPCGMGVGPEYPAVDAEPTEKFWRNAEVDKRWAFPPCTGWTRPGFSTLVTSVARFHYVGGAEGLLRRVGAISELTGVQYWSATHKRWQTLILDATALTSVTNKSHRADFTPDELRRGDDVYFQQSDNLLGKAVYRMRVTECTPDRIVVAVENVDAMRYVVLTLAPPSAVQSVYFFDRESADVWRFFSVFRAGANASGLLAGKPASSVNRAVAFYRHYAGIPTDQNPPSSR